MAEFTIRGENYHWLNETGEKPDNAADLCLHGSVTVTIGDTTLTGVGTVSAAALYLLKSITEDHIPGTDNQMVPCCGHFFCPDEAEENVTIIGCDTGLDWTITHDRDTVVLTLPDCAPVPVAKREYIAEVLRFADSVHRHYIYSADKKLPKDPYSRKGYEVFWKEWHRRYREAAAEAMQDPKERKYTIIETHSNARTDDISDVHLHDAEITATLREGNNITFYLPEGITVNTGAECNTSGRYLQTGSCEIRLVGVTKPETADADKYTIIHHCYHTKNQVLTLDMYPGGPGTHAQNRKYRFACERVEYRFDGFTGDADLQREAEWHLQSFRDSLKKGRGCAHEQVRLGSTPAGRKKLAPVLADAMTSEQRYDRQGNCDRTVYLLDIYDLFEAPEQEEILRSVLDRHMQVSHEDMTTYAPLLKGFAGRGVTEAGEILKKLYDHYRTELEKRTERPDGYDELGGMVELLAWELDIRPHSWEQAPVQRTPEPPLTIETVIERALNWTPPGTFHPARYRAFLRAQPTGKIEQLVQAAEAAEDPEVKARLWSLFDGVAYPGDPSGMIALLKKRLDALKSWVDAEDPVEKQRRLSTMCLARALALMQHPAVRALALEMAEMAKRQTNLRIYALDLWCANFDEKTDIDRLMDFLEKRPSGEEYTNLCHDEDMTILRRLFRHKYEDPRMYGIPVRIYMETYCSTCRHTAVEILARHGMLQEGLRRQCLWDCELSTRELAKEMEGKTI